MKNLLQIGTLKEHTATAEEVNRLLAAVARNIADAKVTAISDETRFDAAYKAIMQLALLALFANGYRPSTSSGGHHMTMIQSLPKSVGLPKEKMVILDALRRKSNTADFMGGYIEVATVTAATSEAENLLEYVKDWIARHRPELLSDSI